MASALLGMGEDARGELYLLVNDFGASRGTSGRLIRVEESAYKGTRKWINRLDNQGRNRRWHASQSCGAKRVSRGRR